MTMWTELFLACRIKEDIPKEVNDILRYLFIRMTYDEKKRLATRSFKINAGKTLYKPQESSLVASTGTEAGVEVFR